MNLELNLEISVADGVVRVERLGQRFSVDPFRRISVQGLSPHPQLGTLLGLALQQRYVHEHDPRFSAKEQDLLFTFRGGSWVRKIDDLGGYGVSLSRFGQPRDLFDYAGDDVRTALLAGHVVGPVNPSSMLYCHDIQAEDEPV